MDTKNIQTLPQTTLTLGFSHTEHESSKVVQLFFRVQVHYIIKLIQAQ